MVESIGAALKAGRARRQLTLAQVSEATRIRVHYLQALENDDLSAMTSAAQARGFLRIYAQFLELDLEALIPPPGPAPAAEAPTMPGRGSVSTAPGTTPQADAGDSVPGLLARLRARLRRPIGPESTAGAVDTPVDATLDPDSKKKAKTAS
jgi:transcriptional regulator with XRE-family HTH domain